jgi:hypothetical protein
MRLAACLLLFALSAIAGLPERVVLVVETRTETEYDLDGNATGTTTTDVYQTVPDLPAFRYASSRVRATGETEAQAHDAIRAEVAGWYQRMGRNIGSVEVQP